MVDIADKEMLKQVLMPPSTVLKQIFSNVGDSEVSDELVSSTTRKVLLSTEDVKLWLEHLAEVIRNRAAKAAETRQRRKNADKSTNQATSTTVTVTEQPVTVREEGYCASCGVDYGSDTGECSCSEVHFWDRLRHNSTGVLILEQH